jgi:hypothetical protein
VGRGDAIRAELGSASRTRALGFGPVKRWGIERASGLDRHGAMYLTGQGHDVRDCSPNRTNERRRYQLQPVCSRNRVAPKSQHTRA